jgi:pyruvate dehydrogenase E2 component (dihydrolipoyllysine-residue acetyltransferase)
MPIEITMPRLSDTMEVGTVIKWNVKVGDEVSAGDILADIETDKATMELQCFDDGTVAKIIANEGDNVEVGKAIMIIAEEDEDVADAASSASSATTAPAAKQESGSTTSAPSATAVATSPSTSNGVSSAAPTTNGRIFASPLARKLAEEKGLDLHAVKGTGPSGRIVKKDVEAATGSAIASAPVAPDAAIPAPAPMPTARLEAKRHELSNMRRTIATRLAESKSTIPHYQVTFAVRMDALMEFRKQLNAQLESQGVKLSVNDFLVRACALAMHQHPFVNSSFLGDAVQIHPDVNIGVAIALPEERGGGLVVATLRNADSMGLRQISATTKALATKARQRGLTVEEMSDSTFTISNLGMFGVEHFNAIINPPNVAILAVGGATKKPVVDSDGTITVGHEMQMTLSSDHRVVDGAMAAAYLASVKQYLENPATILV